MDIMILPFTLLCSLFSSVEQRVCLEDVCFNCNWISLILLFCLVLLLQKLSNNVTFNGILNEEQVQSCVYQ